MTYDDLETFDPYRRVVEELRWSGLITSLEHQDMLTNRFVSEHN